MDINRLPGIQFRQMLPQFIQGNVGEAIDHAAAYLRGGPYVQKLNAAVFGQIFHIMPMELLDYALSRFSMTKPAMFTGSLAEPKGGA